MEAGQGPTVINLDASLTVDKASSLKEELSAALSGAGNILLNLSEVEELDLSCLQVIYAARTQAKASGKTLHLSSPAREHVVARLAACGFLRGPSERSGDLESALVGF
jgi:anti-anti-sigma regulatory factor